MSGGAGKFANGRACSRAVVLLLLLALLASAGCHRHYRPPPSASQSPTTIVKRQLNDDGSYYVRSGDTLYAIAFSYGLDAMEVAKLNGISSPYTIYPGQKIMLKPASGGAVNAPDSSGVTINTLKTPAPATTRAIESPQPSSQETPAPGQATAVPASPVTAATSTSPVAINSVDPADWKWPTDGRVLRSFVAGDPARNGLDIAGKEGQPVTATSGGQVVYSGNGLIGYGELIIIKHSEKMLSAYAHNRVRLVKEGDQVWAGQKIAEMGRNSSDEQVLHFEIRQLGKPVNPMTYLPNR